MRYVERSASPASLDGPHSEGGIEAALAVTHFTSIPVVGKFRFTKYGAKNVRDKLAADFRGKCAYCESRMSHVTPRDIDHFRPKAGYVGPDGLLKKPGYYWLGAEWSNLFPSCPRCNRVATESTPDGSMKVGKGNHFPIANESSRATAAGGEAAEVPLLLNPNQPDVEDHLEFIGDGAVRPAILNGSESVRAASTIRVLGLHRIALSQERARQQKLVKSAIARYRQNRDAYTLEPCGHLNLKRLVDSMQEIREYLCCQQVYLVMTRQMLASECPELAPLPGCTDDRCLTSDD